MGWFFGFKLHLIINDKSEILNFMFPPGNVDNRESLKHGKFLKNIKGKLCADMGYIGQALFENLFLNGIQLVTKVKNNMKNSLMSITDKILFRKRILIETDQWRAEEHCIDRTLQTSFFQQFHCQFIICDSSILLF